MTIACMVTLAACNLDYHEYANYGKDYIMKVMKM